MKTFLFAGAPIHNDIILAMIIARNEKGGQKQWHGTILPHSIGEARIFECLLFRVKIRLNYVYNFHLHHV